MTCKYDGTFFGFLGRSVTKVGLSGAVNTKRSTSGFGLQVMLRGSLFFQVPVH